MNTQVEAKVLDEAVWQAWVLKCIAEHEQYKAVWKKRAQWLSMAAFLVGMGLWSAGILGVRTPQ